MVGYVTLNTRDRDEISVVEDAERLLRAEKAKSDELIQAGRSAEASLVVPTGYYWTWSGQFENHSERWPDCHPRPARPVVDVLHMYLGFGKWWLVFLVFVDIAISFSGGFIGWIAVLG